MKKIITIALMLVVALQAFAQTDYNTWFTDQNLRIDFVLTGNNASQAVYYKGAHVEPLFAGSHLNLIDPFDYGNYYFVVTSLDGITLYSKGFSTLFGEWRTEPESKRMSRAYNNSVSMPMPKVPVVLNFQERVKDTGLLRTIYTMQLDPNDKLITRGKENEYQVVELMNNGPSATKVDLAFVAEGYTAEQMDKFVADATRFMNRLFENAPYTEHRNDFNVWAVKSVSNESGVDFPHLDTWVDSALDSNFFTFRVDRYLTAPDHTMICQAASACPYDALFVIANSEIYGGGGIYNSYAIGTADNRLTESVFVHEFGHSFAGLGDEYYNSEVAYEEFYKLSVEPWEPNITTLVNFDSKWKAMIDPSTPVPTPNVETAEQVVGLYEGGGYLAKGIYRPVWNCRMKSNTAGFCPVCSKAIVDMINYYTDK